MTNSRQKGKRGEMLWRDFLRERGYAEARRGQQFCGGPDSPDVVGGPAGVHFEVKNRERHDVWASMAQAVAEAAAGSTPVVAMKRNRDGWLCVLRADDLLALLERVAPPTPAA